MDHPFDSCLRQELDSLHQGLYDSLDKLDMHGESIAIEAIRKLLTYACQNQHIGHITTARNRLSLVPSQLLIKLIPSIAETTLNLDDSWEYRRFLELLRITHCPLLMTYINRGQNSNSSEVREAANDFVHYTKL